MSGARRKVAAEARMARSVERIKEVLLELGADAFRAQRADMFQLASDGLALFGAEVPVGAAKPTMAAAPAVASSDSQRTMTAAERAAAYRARRAQRHTERDEPRDASRDAVTERVTERDGGRDAGVTLRDGGGDKGGERSSQVSPRNTEDPEPISARVACAGDAQDAEQRMRSLRTQLNDDGTLDAFGEGVRRATGGSLTPLAWRDRGLLLDIVLAHAADLEDRRGWLLERAEAFAHAHDPTYGGFTPRAFGRWVDGGCRPRRQAKGPPVQRYEAPVLTPDEMARLEVL